LQIPDGPKMTRAALSRQAIDGQCSGPFAVWQLGKPLMAPTDPREMGHLDKPKMAHLK